MITRRGCLKLFTLTGVAWIGSGHASYRQWIVYRSERLMIVAGRWEPGAFPLTQEISTDINRAVPESRAEASRAPRLKRIARLILTRQIELAVVSLDEARQIAMGEGAVQSVGPVPLRVLVFLRDPYVLVCHADFDREKAYLTVFGLFDEAGSALYHPQFATLSTATRRANELRIPLHVGAREFFLNPERPPAPETGETIPPAVNRE